MTSGPLTPPHNHSQRSPPPPAAQSARRVLFTFHRVSWRPEGAVRSCRGAEELSGCFQGKRVLLWFSGNVMLSWTQMLGQEQVKVKQREDPGTDLQLINNHHTEGFRTKQPILFWWATLFKWPKLNFSFSATRPYGWIRAVCWGTAVKPARGKKYLGCRPWREKMFKVQNMFLKQLIYKIKVSISHIGIFQC